MTPPPDANGPEDAEPDAAVPTGPGPEPAMFVPRPPTGPLRTSRLAVTTLITGLLGAVPFALGFGIAALVRLRHRTHKGKGLAIGGLAASLAWSVAWTAVTVAALVSASGVEREESNAAAGAGEGPDAIPEEGKVRFATLQAGDCYTGFGPDAMRLTAVDAVPCTEPHRGEVLARAPVLPTMLPLTGKSLNEHATDMCDEETFRLAASKLAEHFEPYVHVADGGRPEEGTVILCAAHYTGDATLDTTVAETMDDALKSFRDLRTGDCVEDIEGLGEDDETVPAVVPLAACTEPHEYQVFASFDIPFEDLDMLTAVPSPSPKAVEERGRQECRARFEKAIDTEILPPGGVRLAFVAPEGSDDLQTIVCFAGLPDGPPLERSIVHE